jgi:hypothetical protein
MRENQKQLFTRFCCTQTRLCCSDPCIFHSYMLSKKSSKLRVASLAVAPLRFLRCSLSSPLSHQRFNLRKQLYSAPDALSLPARRTPPPSLHLRPHLVLPALSTLSRQCPTSAAQTPSTPVPPVPPVSPANRSPAPRPPAQRTSVSTTAPPPPPQSRAEAALLSERRREEQSEECSG